MDGEGEGKGEPTSCTKLRYQQQARQHHSTVSLCCCVVVMTQGGGGIEEEEPSRIHPTQVAPIAMENVRDSFQLFPVARSLDEDYAPRSRAARSGRRVLPVALTPRLILTEFKAAINWAKLQVRSNRMIQQE